MHKIMLFLVAVFTFTIIGDQPWAFATDGSPDSLNALAGAASPLLDSLIKFAGAVILGFIGMVVKTYADKNKIVKLLQLDDLAMRMARNAVKSVEEKALQYKNRNIKRLTTGSDKFDEAVANVLGDVPHLTPEQAQKFVGAAVASIKGIGATGKEHVEGLK